MPLIVALVSLFLWGLMENRSQAEPVEQINGRSFAAIQRAVKELNRRGLELEGYRIQVSRIGESLFVIFIDETQSPDTLGTAPGRKPGVEVELDPDNLDVVKSYFIR